MNWDWLKSKKHRERLAREAAEKLQAERIRLSWSAPACEALLGNGQLVISEPVRVHSVTGPEAKTEVTVRTVPIAGATDMYNFKSTQASKWSTTDSAERSKLLWRMHFESPFYHTQAGKLVLAINKKAVQRDLANAKWLLKNPKTLVRVIKLERVHRQRRFDAALFV